MTANDDSLKNGVGHPQKQRLDWVDYAKGVGIILVVFGHTLRGLLTSAILTPSPSIAFVDRWIYAFHMPLFFFLSGLFLHRSTDRPFDKFLIGRLKTLVYPYFLWSLLQGSLQAFLNDRANFLSGFLELWRIIYEPIMQFWFLYTLFVLSVIYALLRRVSPWPFFFVISSILVYCLFVGQVNLGSWGITYLGVRHSIYLALGALLGNAPYWLSKIHLLVPLGLSLISIVGFILVSLGVVWHWIDLQWAVPLVAMGGIIATIALSVGLSHLKVATSVRFLGHLSLEIYVSHTIVSAMVRIVLLKGLHWTEPISHLLLGTVAGLYFPVLLALLSRKVGFRYLFTFGTR